MTVLDNLEPQVHRSGTWPSYANAKAEYVEGDVRDRSVFEPLVLRSQAVMHFGAAVSVGQSMYQVDRYVDVNTRGTALLLDILVNAKHNVEKVIVASSIGVYGEGTYECAARRRRGVPMDVRRIHFQLVGEVIDHLEHERLLRAVQRPGTPPQGVVRVNAVHVFLYGADQIGTRKHQPGEVDRDAIGELSVDDAWT